MQRLRRALAISALMVLTATACARDGATPAVPPDTPRGETTSPEGAFFAGLLIGRLDGDPQTGCLWLVPTQEPEPVSIQWPGGFTSRTDPLRLVDSRGNVVARRGDLIRAMGGSLPGGTEVEPPGCHVSADAAVAHEIVEVRSTP